MTDRAPGEVETVARALHDAVCEHDWDRATDAHREAYLGYARAALDAARGRSRDDTVTLAEAVEAHRVWASRTFADRQEALLTFGDFLRARFGAGRAEDKP